jgi:hypothetical protein
VTEPEPPAEPDQGEMVNDISPFSALVGHDVAVLIVELAPRKVASRVAKALDHYTKARRLVGVDEEMGAIRCIAAEEELVVSIFEWLKLNFQKVPEHSDFIRKYKNHHVKLAFYPVLSQMRFILADMLNGYISPAGLEKHIKWQASIVLTDKQVKLRLADESDRELIQVNPLAAAVNLDGKTDTEVIDSMFEEMRRNVQEQRGMTIRQFVTARADFRNKLLYAEDRGSAAMAERLEWLIDTVFANSFRDLLWCLAILLSDGPVTKDFGLVSQFISLYRRVLKEAKLV